MEKKSIVCSVIARAVYKGHGYNLGLPSSIAIANSESATKPWHQKFHVWHQLRCHSAKSTLLCMH